MLPSLFPTGEPSGLPSDQPSVRPSGFPSRSPSASPSLAPSTNPTQFPSEFPTMSPSKAPSASPSDLPTTSPSSKPSELPSDGPSAEPSISPSGTTLAPTPEITSFDLYDTTGPTVIDPLIPSYLIDLSVVGTSLTLCANAVGVAQVDWYWTTGPAGRDATVPFCLNDQPFNSFAGLTSTGVHNVTAVGLDALGMPLVPAVTLNVFPFFVTPGRRLLQSAGDLPYRRSNLLAGMLKSNFHGASGPVSFGREYEKGRNSNNITVGLFNIHPKPRNNETGKRSYSTMLTSIYREQDGWQDIPGAVVVNRNGTTTTPAVFRIIFHHNYISRGVRAAGLVLMGIAWTLALASLVLVGWLRNDPIVTRAQPIFLQVLCAGSIITSTAIFTLSWDEGAGWTDQQLDVACTLTPWFFFTGHILMFSALFTKLQRLDRVLQFRRRAVSVRSALWPLVALLASTMSILVLHTTVDPWNWKRGLIADIPSETYGQCTSKHTWAFFGPLVGILFFAELLTMYFAWKTADVPEDFRDSGAVMYACFAQLQGWAAGIPMLVLLGVSSVDAPYFARVFLIWIFSVSGVALVVGPKIYRAVKIRRNPALTGQQRRRSRVMISGLNIHSKSVDSSCYSNTFRQPARASTVSENPRDALEVHEDEDSLSGSRASIVSENSRDTLGEDEDSVSESRASTVSEKSRDASEEDEDSLTGTGDPVIEQIVRAAGGSMYSARRGQQEFYVQRGEYE